MIDILVFAHVTYFLSFSFLSFAHALPPFFDAFFFSMQRFFATTPRPRYEYCSARATPTVSASACSAARTCLPPAANSRLMPI